MRKLPEKLVLIDGSCNFCHKTVQVIEKYSRKPDFYYSNIQSELGKEVINNFAIDPSIDSVIFIEQGKVHLHSTAVLLICKHLRFPFSLASIFLVIPAFVRDPIYRFLAKHRYRFFGKKQECELPNIGFTDRVLT